MFCPGIVGKSPIFGPKRPLRSPCVTRKNLSKFETGNFSNFKKNCIIAGQTCHFLAHFWSIFRIRAEKRPKSGRTPLFGGVRQVLPAPTRFLKNGKKMRFLGSKKAHFEHFLALFGGSKNGHF